jgi:hypothetical protein
MIAAHLIPSVGAGIRAVGEETSWTGVTRSYRKLVDKATATREHLGEATSGSLGNISG